MKELTCRDVCEFLMAYDDGELAPAARAEFERHLSECPACVRYVEGYRRTQQVAKTACCDQAKLPPPPEALISAILKARRAEGDR